MKIGDKIRDVEDGDFFFEGTVTEVSAEGEVLKYLCTASSYGETDEVIGKEIVPRWWYIEKVK